MNKLFLFAGVALLAACNGQQATAPADEANVVAEADATMSLHETTWTFTREGRDLRQSIDAQGEFIVNEGDEHLDHGSYAMVDGKHCFTSAMTDRGQECWTAPANVEVGESVEVTSDEGETLTVTRQAYEPMTMPS